MDGDGTLTDVGASDARRATTVDAREREATVDQVMSTDLATCSPSANLSDCARIMWERRCGSVPIVDHGEPVSIITDRDIAMAAYIQGKPLNEIPVTSAMSRRRLVIGASDTVANAHSLMRRNGVRRLLVVDRAGKLIGLLSIDDILEHGELGPVAASSDDPFSTDAIAETVAALRHAHPKE